MHASRFSDYVCVNFKYLIYNLIIQPKKYFVLTFAFTTYDAAIFELFI